MVASIVFWLPLKVNVRGFPVQGNLQPIAFSQHPQERTLEAPKMEGLRPALETKEKTCQVVAKLRETHLGSYYAPSHRVLMFDA